MRIISGNYRGKKLNALEGINTRPTTDRVKENMFNLIMFDIAGSKVLDLFSGSGSLGIECLSRGASFVDFNDNNNDAIKVIKDNLKGIKGEYQVNLHDYTEVLINSKNKEYDLIFVDAPYSFNIEKELLKTLVNDNIVKFNGKIIYETNRELDFVNDNFEIIKCKKYGSTYVTILRRIN